MKFGAAISIQIVTVKKHHFQMTIIFKKKTYTDRALYFHKIECLQLKFPTE